MGILPWLILSAAGYYAFEKGGDWLINEPKRKRLAEKVSRKEAKAKASQAAAIATLAENERLGRRSAQESTIPMLDPGILQALHLATASTPAQRAMPIDVRAALAGVPLPKGRSVTDLVNGVRGGAAGSLANVHRRVKARQLAQMTSEA